MAKLPIGTPQYPPPSEQSAQEPVPKAGDPIPEMAVLETTIDELVHEDENEKVAEKKPVAVAPHKKPAPKTKATAHSRYGRR